MRTMRGWFVGLSLGVVACGGSGGEASAPPTGEAPVDAAPGGEVSGGDAPADAPVEGSAPGSEAPSEGGGRLAFVPCEEPRKKACTKEYRPVCAEVDTGIRCVTAPCPSSEKKTYGNACMACGDAAVSGYFPQACDALGTSASP